MIGGVVTLPVEALAPILGVPAIAEDFVACEALATRLTDARVLYRIARSLQPSTILEIGTFYGHTAVGLARNCPDATIYTVDVCQEMNIPVPPSQFVELLPRNQIGRRFRGTQLKIVQIIGDSRNPAIYSQIPTIDLAYIDGNHSREAILQDSRNVVRCCRSGGVIVWHDYKDDPSVETIPALEELIQTTRYPICHVEGTWLAVMVAP